MNQIFKILIIATVAAAATGNPAATLLSFAAACFVAGRSATHNPTLKP